MKSIYELIPDIQAYLKTDPDFLQDVGRLLIEHPRKVKKDPHLRLSKMGPKCPRALWYSIHHPELDEPLPPWATFKFSFGHMIEAAATVLAKASGYTVTGEQDAVCVDGISGHRDCIINGRLLDVKSCSSIAFSKYRSGSLSQSDDFGYLDQLDGYLLGSVDDPLLLVKDVGYLLMIDKVLGHMYLHEHHLRESSIRARIASHKRIVACTSPPDCECGTLPDGESGNIKLDLRASYSPQKYSCFPNLRTFIFAGGKPRFFTTVKRRPAAHIPEVDKHGNFIYS